MRISSPGLRRSLLAAAALLGLSAAASAQMELKILAPAAPGGGWDQTARSMQQALTQSGVAKSVQVTNVPGAGGTVGIAQFVNSAKGDGNQLMVIGFVMVGALLTNKSPVTLDQTTPIARLTERIRSRSSCRPNSPIKNAKDLAAAVKADPGQGDLGRRLGRRRRSHRGGAVRQGGRRRSDQDQLHPVLGRRRGAGGDPRRQGHGRHFRLRRVREPDQGRQAAPHRPDLGRQALPNIDVPTLKEQGVDLEIANWRAVVAPPGITADQKKALTRDHGQADEVEGMGGDPEGQGLGRRLSAGRRLRQRSWPRSRRASHEVLMSVGLVKVLKSHRRSRWKRRAERGASFGICPWVASRRDASTWRPRDRLCCWSSRRRSGRDTHRLSMSSAYGLGPKAMPIIVAAGLAILAVGNGIMRVPGRPAGAARTLDWRAIILILGGLAALIALIGFGGGFIPGDGHPVRRHLARLRAHGAVSSTSPSASCSASSSTCSSRSSSPCLCRRARSSACSEDPAMEAFISLAHGCPSRSSPMNLLFALIGVLLGTAVGVLPGIGPALTVALLLPITFKLDPTRLVIMFAGIYYGGMYGGSTTSILLNTPGESASIVDRARGQQDGARRAAAARRSRPRRSARSSPAPSRRSALTVPRAVAGRARARSSGRRSTSR